jgi:hypothetical protein
VPNRYGTSREGRKSLYLCPPLVPMDLADASLISMAESHNLEGVFTIDRKDFFVYRVKCGHRNDAFKVIGAATDSA